MRKRFAPWLAFLFILILWIAAQFTHTPDSLPTARALSQAISGRILDEQDAPVSDVEVALFIDGQTEPIATTRTQENGSFYLTPDTITPESMHIVFDRPHFESFEWQASPEALQIFADHNAIALNDIYLKRRYGLSFWIATLAFLGMLTFIATERLHNTLTSLLAVAVIFGVSLVGGAFNPNLYILDFEQAIRHVDFAVIFLLLGMMIVIGIIEETGIFQWLAYLAYRLSRGKVWLLTVILMVITSIASALLDNVTTMLLMTPITFQIALALGISPLSLLMPEVLASNVGGISTLVGTPTNILIGSYSGLGFNDFLVNQTPGVILALLGLIGYVLFRYRKEHRKAGGEISPALLERLEENARIKEPLELVKAGIVFAGLLVLFVTGESIHLVPAVAAIIGAVAMLLWVHPDIEQMMTVVDWTTLIFFIGMFIVIGAIQEVGLIFLIAGQIGHWVGTNVVLAILLIVWVTALLSGVIANIPFAAAMLPVVGYLTRTIPDAHSRVLFYALSIGAAMGGNSSLIGASANLVTAGIASRAGYSISFWQFLKVGLPATLITVALGTLWLFIRF